MGKTIAEINKRIKDKVYFSRKYSYAFLNLCARILEEDWLHFKVRFGRERFHAVDSLCNIAAIIPYKNHSLEFHVSFPTGFISYLPETNQRMGISYFYYPDPYVIGVSLGYLLKNYRGGGGVWAFSPTDLNHYSLGISMGVKW